MAHTLSQITRKDKARNLATLKRRAFDARVDRLIEAGALNSDAPLPERVHALLLSNRPGASELPAPVLIQTSPNSFIASNDDPPAPTFQPIFDLIIVTRRVAKFTGHTQSNDGKILWIKRAGCDKQFPQRIHRLSDADTQAKLARYELVKQVAQPTEIWHYYKLAIVQNQVAR